jgi:putative flippase GtrA
MADKKFKVGLSGTFIKAQFSSIISTLIDFLLTHFLTGTVGLWYLFSSSLGTVTGGCVNFMLGRFWVFNARKQKKTFQAKRYVLVWAGSLLLNTLGVYVLTEILKLHYMLSKAMVAVIVGVSFNFYLQKSFVFKP